MFIILQEQLSLNPIIAAYLVSNDMNNSMERITGGPELSYSMNPLFEIMDEKKKI